MNKVYNVDCTNEWEKTESTVDSIEKNLFRAENSPSKMTTQQRKTPLTTVVVQAKVSLLFIAAFFVILYFTNSSVFSAVFY